MAQTAVEWLEKQLISEGIYVGFGMYEQAKQMEKEQISQGYVSGLIDGINQQPKEYYNQTYGKE